MCFGVAISSFGSLRSLSLSLRRSTPRSSSFTAERAELSIKVSAFASTLGSVQVPLANLRPEKMAVLHLSRLLGKSDVFCLSEDAAVTSLKDSLDLYLIL